MVLVLVVEDFLKTFLDQDLGINSLFVIVNPIFLTM